MTSGLKILEAVTTISKIEELEEGDRDLLLRDYRKELECAFHKLQALLQPTFNSTTQSSLEISAPPGFLLTPAQFFEHVQPILSEIKDIIKHRSARTEKITGMVWDYSGPELSNGAAKLSKKLTQLGEDKFRVMSCVVIHIENGTDVIISSHTGPSMLLIPLDGSARFGPDEPLLPCHYIKEERNIFSENIDVVVVGLEMN